MRLPGKQPRLQEVTAPSQKIVPHNQSATCQFQHKVLVQIKQVWGGKKQVVDQIDKLL